MPNLTHPGTGEHVRASRATADRLISEGWEETTSGQPADEAPAAKSEPKSAPPKTEQTPSPAADAKPLDKLKLPELLAHAEKIGVPAEQIDALRKPGTSKKQAIEAINAHLKQA